MFEPFLNQRAAFVWTKKGVRLGTPYLRDSSPSYKIDYVIVFKTFLNLEGHQNRIIRLKNTAILQMGEFCLLVDLHWEGSAPAACGAGLFSKKQKTLWYYSQIRNT